MLTPTNTKLNFKHLKNKKAMANHTEIRWSSGQDEYTVSEIEYMLQSQRAMIYNDINHLIRQQKGSGKRSKEEIEIMDYLRDPRKVEI